METALDLYKEIASLYMHLVKQDSPEAGEAIEQIQSLSGARAALRAGLIMKIFKMDAQQARGIADFNSYANQLEDYPEALPLLKLAMTHWLRDAKITNRENNHLGFGSGD